ncbi:N(2)-fixation sustaining protein CowN [Reinekea thalattae]|uniref:N(2)-fixation sustaining protein CowN n=1 Tax=Reinekea thalattae TaxID=2593301 RepID=A0A5C8Z803_9GAMM|nr:N(2)-fixation sustaining protein CowN [Reinekea thalattae]TXR53030.1 N(2)-fixation sustaining protein CowN [Reinekea thalattae]
MTTGTTKDRYVTFCDIECDRNANELIAKLDRLIAEGRGSEQWRHYFRQKREEQLAREHDNLHLIGNQINPLYEFFNEVEDEQAVELLYQIEQECC